MRVLVVDDADVIRRMLTAALVSDGHLVVGEACDGAEGVDAAIRLTPDAVVIDWRMPVMDGMEALPRLRKALPSARVVMYSSEEGESAQQLALDAGADAFVGKDRGPCALLEVLDLDALPSSMD